MAITADNQFDVNGVLTMGAGTNYSVLFDGVKGFGTPSFRSSDLPFGAIRDGVAPGFDTLEARAIALPFMIRGQASASATMQAWTALKAAWQPASNRSGTVTAAGEQYLDARLPGMPVTTMRSYGRCRGIPDDEIGPGQRWITGTGIFLGTDPLLYDASATAVSADSSSPVPLPNAGNQPTRRCTLTVVGSGSAPVITNPNSLTGGAITFSTALSGTATIDLYAQTVTVSGVDHTSDVDPSSLWFELQPGTNDVTFTGCTSVAASYRSAWL